MSTAPPMIPPDDPKRNLTLARPDNLTHVGLVGDTYTITVTGEDTNGRFCVIDMHIPPRGGPPPHRHDFEETFILLEGEIEATFRGKKSIVRAGDTLNIPANAPHQFHNTSTASGAHALYLLPGGTGEILPGSWSAGRNAYHTTAEAGRKRAGRIHRESEDACTQVPHRTTERGIASGTFHRITNRRRQDCF